MTWPHDVCMQPILMSPILPCHLVKRQETKGRPITGLIYQNVAIMNMIKCLIDYQSFMLNWLECIDLLGMFFFSICVQFGCLSN